MDSQELLNAILEAARPLVHNALVKTTKDLAMDIFRKSQKNVPVVTGHLKRSGKVTNHESGATVEYDALYARKVHDGTGPGWRRMTSREKSSFLNRHTTYGGSKLSPTRFRNMRVPSKGSRSNPFLRRALDEAMETNLIRFMSRRIRSELHKE